MGLKTVDKYVSSQEIMDIVSSIDIAQGYEISKPIIIKESPEKTNNYFLNLSHYL